MRIYKDRITLKFINPASKLQKASRSSNLICGCCCCMLTLSKTNRNILWGLILHYLGIKGMLLKTRPGRAGHIRGGKACFIHPGSRDLLLKHPMLTGHVLMLAPTLIYLCVHLHASCIHVNTYIYIYLYIHIHHRT